MIDLTLLSYAEVWAFGPLLLLSITCLLLLALEVSARAVSRRVRGFPPHLHAWVTGTGLATALIDSVYLLTRTTTVDLGIIGRLFSAHGLIDTELQKPFWTGFALQSDRFALTVTIVVCGVGLLALFTLQPYLQRRGLFKAEIYPLLLVSLTGMALLAYSKDLLITFIAVEVLSLPLYVLCGLDEKYAPSRESSLKYFLLGAFASGFFVYGLSLVYGVVGNLNYSAVAFLFDNQRSMPTLAALGFVLIGVGLAFKIALVPFHAWLPDVYQGAPTPITGLMAAGVKVGIFCAAQRIIYDCFTYIDPGNWRTALAVFAVLSMVVGNLFALHQLSLKRLLAYSAITHTGFLAVGLCAATGSPGESLVMYLAAYCVAALGAFAIIGWLAQEGQDDVYLEDVQDLAARHPLAALTLTILLLSMAGFPLTAGFIGKLAVFTSAWGAGLTGLVVFALINSVVSAYFYLRVIMAMYMQPAPSSGGRSVPALMPLVTKGLALAAVLLTLGLGLLPQLLYTFSNCGLSR